MVSCSSQNLPRSCFFQLLFRNFDSSLRVPNSVSLLIQRSGIGFLSWPGTMGSYSHEFPFVVWFMLGTENRDESRRRLCPPAAVKLRRFRREISCPPASLKITASLAYQLKKRIRRVADSFLWMVTTTSAHSGRPIFPAWRSGCLSIGAMLAPD